MGIILTQGSFDIFHRGHIKFLKRCARLGDVYVGLLTDEAYEKYRGYKPVKEYEDRFATLITNRYVTKVFGCEPHDMKLHVDAYKPTFIAIGTDWVTKNIYKQWGVTPEQIDDKLIYIPYTKGISSTDVKEKIKKT